MDFDFTTMGMGGNELLVFAIPAAVALVSMIIMLVIFYLIIKRAVYAGFKKFYREAQQNEQAAAQAKAQAAQNPPAQS
ncbi:hypothetical protein [uncultured Adlercreutzia sp.]|uniref:hypothetical protein n=1 Tax=uncultured Adlercreutzia sp. TaxID=875803 RepID=UPI0026F404ED|nr:hypothetical protein [uncultured Adlercreutzia sp.]